MLTFILYIFLGFIILLLSGHILVKGAVTIAAYFRISTLVIGATVVSMGTSVPELLVSIQAALVGKPEIALGSVIGSNISNIALVLGLTALILPIPVRNKSVKWDWLVMMFSTVLLYIAIATSDAITFWQGIFFTSALAGYIVWTIYRSRKANKNNNEVIIDKKVWFNINDIISLFKHGNTNLPLSLAFILVIIASIGLVFGAQFLVDGASGLAFQLGVSERVVAVSIIAFGTSVPELVTSIMAAIKKEMDISIGNIIGSNIFNILGILGVTSIVKEIVPKHPSTSFSNIQPDIIWMFGISFLLIIVLLWSFKIKGKKFMGITRFEGAVLVALYLTYIFWVFN